MNLKNQRPIFVPHQYCKEIEKLSKAALMDMVWDMATQLTGDDSLANTEIIARIQQTAEIVLRYRKQEKA